MRTSNESETKRKETMQTNKKTSANGLTNHKTGGTVTQKTTTTSPKKYTPPVQETDEFEGDEEISEINVGSLKGTTDSESLEQLNMEFSEEEEEEKPVEETPKPQPRKPVPHKEVPRSMTTQTQNRSMTTSKAPTVKSNALTGDLLIPRVLLMQGLSDLVVQRKAFAGQIVRSPSGELLGGYVKQGQPPKSVNLIPLSMSTSWSIFLKDGNKWIGTEPRTVDNDALPWEFENEDGEECKRIKTVELIGLLETDLEKQTVGINVDEDGLPLSLDDSVLLPVALSFKSTSFVAGKGVSTFFAKIEAASKQFNHIRPYHFTLPINCTEESNDDGTFYVFEVGTATKTTKEYAEIASTWYTQVQTKNVMVEGEQEAESRTGTNLKAQNMKTNRALV